MPLCPCPRWSSREEASLMAGKAVAKILRRILKPRPQNSTGRTRTLPEGHKTPKLDEFAWLENLRGQDTAGYIKAENRYTTLQLFHTKFFQWKVKKYLKNLSLQQIQDDDHNVSELLGSYEYFSKFSPSGLPVVYRRQVNSNCDPTVILDHNDLAKDTGFVSAKSLKISPSQKYFAVVFNRTGAGSNDCNIYSTTPSGSILLQELQNVSNIEWCNDDDTLILTCASRTSPGIVNIVKRYSLSKRKMETMLIENDSRFSIDITKSRDGNFILVHSHSKACSEVHSLSADNPQTEPICIQKRDDGKECFADHMNNYFYALRSSDQNGEYKIARMCSEHHNSYWEEIFPLEHVRKTVILDMELFSETCVAYELNNLIPQLTTFQLDNPGAEISLPVANCSAVLESFSNQDPKSPTLRFSVTSPIKPLTIFELDQRKKLVKEVFRSLKDWDSSKYNFKLLEAKSQDGTNVPVSVFFSKDIKDLSNAPMLVTVYGSYGIPVDLQFTYERAFLLSRGWILAFPHVRGGGELGRAWYRSATKSTKKRTFEDLKHCLLELHKNAFSSPAKTALLGNSAGGLAVAVLCNTSPQLIKAAVLKVPFVDVSRSMLYEFGLNSQEYEEWGDVRNSLKDRSYVLSYCPYENLKYCENFPSVYIQTNLEDDLVPAWIPLKWAAKLRYLESHFEPASAGGKQLILCRTYAEGGHFGAYGQSKENQTSEIIAFLYAALQIKTN